MKYLLFLSIIALTLVTSEAFGQSDSTYFRYYGTQKYNFGLLQTDSSFANNQLILDQISTSFLYEGEISSKTLNVVFHIIQSVEMPQISDNDIETQIVSLNNYFNTLSERIREIPDSSVFFGRASAPMLSFCLPDSSELPDNTSPITRTTVPHENWGISDSIKHSDLGGSDAILPEYILNIWVCDLIDQLTGYAQFPGGPFSSDGIVIDFRYLDIPSNEQTPFNEGRSMVHLVGSYLGLVELWNDIDRCFDDKVYDTPIHNDPNIGFEIVHPHYSTCLGNDIEMTINYMDNTYDSIPYIFTKGQVFRMHSVLSERGFRHNLVSEELKCRQLLEESLPLTNIIPDEQTVKLNVYPNPVSDLINIHFESNVEKSVTIIVYDINGRIVDKTEFFKNTLQFNHTIDVQNYTPGIYCLKVDFDDGSIIKSVIVIQ